MKPSAVRVNFIPMPTPLAETELQFWRRKAAERATLLADERAKNQRLTLRILALLEEEA